ncbi:MAG: GAF domain-containing SpoIIE family protein phosphatase [Desulfobacteraceae bacterium]|jgi:serine phosphatase RsbU (regulator of sigma subunit)|nr:GAF domain-containing SpoIIE family protein phosphatase [Desulfobacteraceae bacterium]
MNHNECQHHIDPVSNRLRKLIEANRSLAEIESLDDLLQRLMDLAKKVTAAEASMIFLYNSATNLLEVVSISDDRFGDRANELYKGKDSIKLKMGEGVAGWVAQNRKAVIIEDAQNDSRLSKPADKQRGLSTRTLISVPLIYQEELLGVLSVVNSEGKPFFDNEDLEILESFAALSAVAIIRSRLLEHRIEQERLRTELEAATKIQELFWPKLPELGEGSHVWGFSEPAGSVGGDLYDVIPMPDGSWLVYVADVSGKGLPAALMMAALSAKIRSIAPLHSEVDKLLASVNKEMYELMSEEGFFATMVLSKYWPRTGRVQIARAGHPYPLWVINHGLGELPNLGGLPIGVEFGTEYGKTEFVLSSGEALLFITDGVTEAENEESELFGDDRLADYFKAANGPPWTKDLLDRIDSWRGNTAMNDDLTMVEIWRDPPR